jgi:hypothetical protein|tara:strand:+ start:2022 stop:3041 length:1020 start_codon:yes stop_codon:yes gene_type:complete
MKTKFAIGCLVQWYEAEIIEEYAISLLDAIKSYDGEVIVDFHVTTNEDLEKPVSAEKMKYCEQKIKSAMAILGVDTKIKISCKLVTIADYRRRFNTRYCNKVDVLMWGESDSLIPRQTFQVLDILHQGIKDKNPKYLSFFGTCKMWDDSWKVLEHPDFTDKPFIDHTDDSDKWWSLKYTMNKEEMDNINEGVEDLDVRVVSPHKFNGCGLVISSEVIKAGVNIPKSVFFVHEDTAFQHMTNRVLGNIPQYVIKNILLVHNRKHPKKRMYVQGEDMNLSMQGRREASDWYLTAHQMSEANCYNLFNPNWKSFTWEDARRPEYKDYAFSEAVKRQRKERNG